MSTYQHMVRGMLGFGVLTFSQYSIHFRFNMVFMLSSMYLPNKVHILCILTYTLVTIIYNVSCQME